MGDLKVRRRKHRLPRENYVGRRTVAFTCCLETRKTAFCDANVVDPLVEILGDCCHKHSMTVPIYCFMPDHAHIILMGQSDSSDSIECMIDFKRETGIWLGSNAADIAWQESFYDRILRPSMGWKNQVFYVLQNPVRAGLVEDVWAYPFTGSIGHNLLDLVNDLSW